ncbi:MAG: hypothetical protein HQK79_10810 [Desulfobacterales bacterium]|nr:hypothetical protein [Desulfobacterales bacterium]MBF0396493.1 hypothetical protein [Desulfobacterales bacterium]
MQPVSANLRSYLYQQKTCKICGQTSPAVGWKNCGGCPVCVSAAREKDLMKKPGCARCDSSGKTELHWNDVLKKGEHSLAKYRQFIIPKKKLRFGKLYECSRCKRLWVLDDRFKNMTLLPKKSLKLFEEWCEKSQKLPRNLLKKALAIGAVCYYDFFYIPCKVLIQEGVELDYSVLSFQSSPPINDWRKNLRLASEIRDILPSSHALPLPVRNATSDHWNVPYAGAIVSTPNKEYLHIHFGAQFLDLVGIEPSNLFLEDHPEKIPTKAHIRQVNNKQSKITYFLADWVLELGQLYRKNL